MAIEHDLIKVIKGVALNAVAEQKPADITFGTVESVAPLKININQKMILDSKYLILSDNVKDYEVEMSYHGHHETATIYNGLKAGESVMLIRLNGGQTYFVARRC